MTLTRKYAVFNDNRGNRFVFPSIYSDHDKSIDWWNNRMLCMRIGIEEEDERLVVPFDDEGRATLDCYATEIISSGFAHGAATVWLISGPWYEEAKEQLAMQEAENETKTS